MSNIPKAYLACYVLLALAASALAVEDTVSPANTVVVINAASPASDKVAREWMHLRGIPDAQALVLKEVPVAHSMPLADFRKLVLDPLEAELVRRGRAERTTLVAYGPDFPTAISFDDAQMPEGRKSPGSLTGFTLLAPWLAEGAKAFTALDVNQYAERALDFEFPGSAEGQRAKADERNGRAEKLFMVKDFSGAEALLKDLTRDIAAPAMLFNLACAQAVQDKKADALATLGRAIDAGWFNVRQASALKGIREDPAWPALVKRMQAQTARIRPGPSTPFVNLPSRAGSPPGRLAIMLAATSGRGVSIDEALAHLKRSVEADRKKPDGAVYFMVSTDIARTPPRSGYFAAAANALRELGVQAEVLEGVLPPKGSKVSGAVIGIADFNWESCGAEIQPGAWCDHLTSFGGALQPNGGQTPLTVFLKYGAAGSGGAVFEPLNLPMKFPSAFMHVHRARGLSLIEAVHRTMSCPYQYLVVGDPLSRPWPRPVEKAR